MIHFVTSDHKSFRSIEFSSGFNVIIADHTKNSTLNKSHNGLGKSTLLDIIHFCLGGMPRNTLLKSETKGWAFSLGLDTADNRVIATRRTGNVAKVALAKHSVVKRMMPMARSNSRLSHRPQELHYSFHTQRLPSSSEKVVPPESDLGKTLLDVEEWQSKLGATMFGLDERDSQVRRLGFRSLLSFFARRDNDIFASLFDFCDDHSRYDFQFLSAYLLGLESHDALELKRLQERSHQLRALRSAPQWGVFKRLIGSAHELKSRRDNLRLKVQKEERELRTFRVHRQYSEIAQRANEMTEAIHELAGDNVIDNERLRLYESSISEQQIGKQTDVTQIYNEASIILGESIQKRLDEVKRFHRDLIANRRNFLSGEIDVLIAKIKVREKKIKKLTSERAEYMTILKTHDALEEYTRLQRMHLSTVAKLENTEARLKIIQEIEDGESALALEKARLIQHARQSLRDTTEVLERASRIFNSYSQALYNAPGSLAVTIGQTGFKFDVSIERSGCQGIDKMKVFCYDLMLARLWSRHNRKSSFLIHDSTLFDGVDSLQIARALELARRESEQHGFQYICIMDSDMIPMEELPPDFSINEFVRLKLTDAIPEDSLLGIRF